MVKNNFINFHSYSLITFICLRKWVLYMKDSFFFFWIFLCVSHKLNCIVGPTPDETKCLSSHKTRGHELEPVKFSIAGSTLSRFGKRVIRNGKLHALARKTPVEPTCRNMNSSK